MHLNDKRLLAGAGLLAAAALVAGSPASAAAKDKVKVTVNMQTLSVAGTSGDDAIALRLAPGDPSTLEVVVGGSAVNAIKRSRFDHIEVTAAGGNDSLRIDESNGAFSDTEATTLNGGAGDDTITGGSFAETLIGGAGNDSVDGNRGADTALLGAGDDTFIWDPGDASDTVEGGLGADTLQFNGANIAEKIDLSANGPRLRLTRDIAAITMDTAGVESVNVAAKGGTDAIAVHDLTGTGVTAVAVDLGSDTQADTVSVDGTAAADTISVRGTQVSGLATTVSVSNADATDVLSARGLGGADRFTADPRIASLVDELVGGDGNDSTVVDGTDGSDAIGIQANGPAAAVFEPGAASHVDVETENLRVNGGGGDDSITAGNGLSTLTSLTIDGGAGNDTIAGGDGDDVLFGGDGNDIVDGNRGADTAFLGAGDDTFIWDPGDGSDTVEGQDGADTLQFNGANIAEQIDLSANGTRLRFTRDVAAITMDTAGVESVNVAARGGTDAIAVHDLTGTGVAAVAVDLGSDTQADVVSVDGTAGPDAIDVHGTQITGLATTVSVSNADPIDVLSARGLGGDDRFTADPAAASLVDELVGGEGNDSASTPGSDAADTIGIQANGPAAAVFEPSAASHIDVETENLRIDGRGGDDTITAGNGLATLTSLVIDGGDGNDTIAGGDGNDVLFGGDGNDAVDGNRGADTAFLGAGDDTFTWDPGDGSDTVEGQDGTDLMLFNGANIAEKIDLSANGTRLRFTRDIASIVMDTAGVEAVQFIARGGADAISVHDLTGTDVAKVGIDLGTDGAADTVSVDGTQGEDVVAVTGGGGAATVSGLRADVLIVGGEPGQDRLAIATFDGDDVVEASGLHADSLLLTADGGKGDDVLTGGDGDDTLLGGEGDDVLIGGPGSDVLDGGPGSNVVIQ